MKTFDFQMEIGPDGSLCRITSSAKDFTNNIKIVKVSEEELLDANEPPYKLVLIGEEINGCESLSEKSEKSDEEILEEEKIDIELSTENIEKEKDVKVQDAVEELKPQSEKFVNKTFNKRYRLNNVPQNRKNYNFPGKRHYNSAGNASKTYKRPVTNTASQDIQPWLNPPQILNPQYPIFPHYAPVMEPLLNNSIKSNGGVECMDSIIPNKTVGLLGDSPYLSNFPQHSFQSTNQSNHFGHSQNYWNNEYSSSYQRSAQNISNSRQSNHKKYYPQNKYWKNKNGQGSWKRNQKESQKERRNNNGHFDYRN